MKMFYNIGLGKGAMLGCRMVIYISILEEEAEQGDQEIRKKCQIFQRVAQKVAK
jgi:hypothetical protein